MGGIGYSHMLLLRILSIGFTMALIVFVIEAIRRHRLNERYAILWLGAGGALLVLSLYRPLLDWVALSLGVSYPPSFLFLVAFVFLLGIVLHYSLVISSHRDSIRRLTQTVALLERALDERYPPSPPAGTTAGAAPHPGGKANS